MDVYIQGKRVRLNPSQSIGKGGEADVFSPDGQNAIKIFKPPNHPDFQGLPHEQQAAEIRIAEHQQKLRAFPKGLPSRVIVPEHLATDHSGQRVVGYQMRFQTPTEVLLRYGERVFRQAGISNEMIVKIFLDLHQTVTGIHQSRVVIGDFNDLNILVQDTAAYIIDADSFQFGRWLSKMFTGKFVDPLLCDPRGHSPMLHKPHNPDSDWYAFAVMLMQCLIFVGPYGGVYRPKDKGRKIPHDARPLHRITVFHPEVRYPKPATPYGILPDDLLQRFHLIFEKDERGNFPVNLLQDLRWTTCSVCGTEHARHVCPGCATTAPAAIKETTIIRGTVTVTRIFQTPGIILYATVQNGKPHWLYHENNGFRREDRSKLFAGSLDPQMRFRIQGSSTLVGKTGQVIKFAPAKQPERITVDNFGALPIFDANGTHHYWLNNGQLLADDQLGSKHIGDVLQNQTLFWVGDTFGFGFYRAGNLNVAFVFDAKKSGINDTVALPPLRGQLIDATCYFSQDYAWFLVSTRQGGKTINQCMLIKPDGSIKATASAEEGDDSWLSTIRGKCAASNFLLVATDEGIVRIEPDQGRLVEIKKFPDTEPFVDTSCHLFVGHDGLYVVDRQEIRILKIR